MTPEEFQNLLGEYIDDGLNATDRARVERMTAESPVCARLHRDAVAMRERLRQLPRVRPSAEFEFALRSRLMVEAARQGRLRRRVRALLFPTPLRSAATFAAAAALLLAFEALSRRAPEEPLADAFRLTRGRPSGSGTVESRPAEATVSPSVSAAPPVPPVVDRGALTHLSKQDAYALSGRLYRNPPDTTVATPRVNPQPVPVSGSAVRRVPVSF